MTRSKTAQNITFFGSWAKSYDHPLVQFWMKRFQLPVLTEIDFSRSASVLDISCGTGELLRTLYKRDAKKRLKFTGMDLTSILTI